MQIYLGLGSNLGDRRAHLERALARLAASGVELGRLSPVVESPALLPPGAPSEWNRPFLNMVAECRTRASPGELRVAIKAIERELGRDGGDRWAPRPVDIDILLWGNELINDENLRIPHPELHKRSFVLTPLIALAPRLTIPGLAPKTLVDWSFELKHHIPLWMGIVNVTPDSFSDGGRLVDWDAVEPHVAAMVEGGAHIVDVGAESTRPGATPLSPPEEWARLQPVLEPLIEKYRRSLLRPLVSVDTRHAEVARRALALGADMINDVSGLTSPAMIELAIESGKDWVAMHQLTLPADPAVTLSPGTDPVEAVERWIDQRLEAWQTAGLDLNRVIVDPGIGFGKNPLQSVQILRRAGELRSHGLRVAVGHSRKSFMKSFSRDDPRDRELATLGASLNLCAQGVDVLRVHDVPSHAAAYRGWAQLVG